MSEWLTQLFSLVCGRHPEHLWAPGGFILPCCQRCTGLYVGAFCAGLIHLLLRPRATPCFLWVHVLLLLQMAPFGFHWVSEGPILRTLSGAGFAFGLVACLWLLPSARWFRARERRRWDALEYGLALGVGVALPLALALWGGRAGAVALSALASLGAVTVFGLALLSLALLADSFCRSHPRPGLGLVA
jgi:uncharacterized membrane protein